MIGTQVMESEVQQLRAVAKRVLAALREAEQFGAQPRVRDAWVEDMLQVLSQNHPATSRWGGSLLHDWRNLFMPLLEGSSMQEERFRLRAHLLRDELQCFLREEGHAESFEDTDLRTFLRDFSERAAERFPERALYRALPLNALPVCVPTWQLTMALFCLLTNADQASGPGKPLVLSGSWQRLTDERVHQVDWSLRPHVAGFYAVVTVRDWGSGMAPEVRGRLFAEPVTTKEYGTGQGMMEVARMIRIVRGGVRLASGQDGTEISLFLPLLQEPELQM